MCEWELAYDLYTGCNHFRLPEEPGTFKPCDSDDCPYKQEHSCLHPRLPCKCSSCTHGFQQRWVPSRIERLCNTCMWLSWKQQ